MMYPNAKKLKCGDKIRIKETGQSLTVVEVKINVCDIYVKCSDNNWYHHRTLM